MKTKLFFLAISIFYLSFSGYSQTSIGPTIGLEFSNVIETQEALHGDCPTADWLLNKEGLGHQNFISGIRADQELFRIFKLTIKTAYTRKKLVDDNCRSFDLKYNVLSSSLLISFKAYDKLYLGVGASYNNHQKYNFGQMYLQSENFIGLIVSSSYKYKNILFDISFDTLKNIDKDNQYPYRMIMSSKSLELSASYMFDILK